MGCLSAQLVSHFKDWCRVIYICIRLDTKDVWEDYTYLIEGKMSSNQLKVKVLDSMKRKRYLKERQTNY